jgi:hypothetical protein
MADYRDNLLPGKRARSEQDRAERNLIITPLSFEGEHTIQLRCGVAQLCTVSEPAGPGGKPEVFHVYKEPLNYHEEVDYDDPDNIVKSFHVANYGGWVGETWAEAVKFAYSYAIERVINELVLTETVA